MNGSTWNVDSLLHGCGGGGWWTYICQALCPAALSTDDSGSPASPPTCRVRLLPDCFWKNLYGRQRPHPPRSFARPMGTPRATTPPAWTPQYPAAYLPSLERRQTSLPRHIHATRTLRPRAGADDTMSPLALLGCFGGGLRSRRRRRVSSPARHPPPPQGREGGGSPELQTTCQVGPGACWRVATGEGGAPLSERARELRQPRLPTPRRLNIHAFPATPGLRWAPAWSSPYLGRRVPLHIPHLPPTGSRWRPPRPSGPAAAPAAGCAWRRGRACRTS